MRPEPGLHLGAYEIIEPLGRGGMGDVYRARDTRLGRQVAVKFVAPEFDDHSAAVARLHREARLASSLNHPGIVTVLDVGQWQDRPYVVMELVDGTTLADVMANDLLPVKEVAALALQIADALAAAHGAGVVHRDLKPHNIMVTPDRRVKIVDFGLSRETRATSDAGGQTITAHFQTEDHAILGTVGYMSPEQVRGLTADGRADQFAFGVIVYEMLTGRRAFKADSNVQTLTAILVEEPTPVASIRHGVPDALSVIVNRCLAKRPEQRYASTQDLAHDMRDVVEQQLVDTRSLPMGRRPGTDWRRTAIATLGAMVAFAIGLLLWQRVPTAGPAAAHPTAMLRQIVVLPFANITKDEGDQVFADGLVETLTSSLTELERFQRTLRVVPASEVRAARIESAKDARQAFAATLAVSGSIQRGPTAIRLTLNLVDATQLVQLASRTIELAIGPRSITQDTVVGALTALLDLQLQPDATQALHAGGTTTPGAYEQFVQGRGYLHRFDRGAENVERAIAALNNAVAIDPRYARAQAALGEAYWRQYEIDRQTKWIDLAVQHCERALAIDNRQASVHVTMALIARGRGRYEEAAAIAQRAVELDPVGSDGYRELGRAYEALNRLPDAEATYRRAVDARPDDWLTFNTLGAFMLARGRWPEAEAAYRRVVELTPDNTRGYNNLGVTFLRMDRIDDAVAMWERSLAIRPSFSAASNVGSYYYSQRRYADAARAFERAVALAPSDRRLWRNLGAALHWAPGERDKAAAAYEKAVALGENERKVNPRQAALLAELADSYSMLGKRPDALAAIAAAERLESKEPEALFMLATANEQIGDRAQALEWLARALEQGYSKASIDRSPGLEALRKDDRFVRLSNKTR